MYNADIVKAQFVKHSTWNWQRPSIDSKIPFRKCRKLEQYVHGTKTFYSLSNALYCSAIHKNLLSHAKECQLCNST